MPQQAALKKRVEQLEQEVKAMKLQLQAREQNKVQDTGLIPGNTERKNSWLENSGIFADDPLFEKAMRYGRAYRRSLRPKTRKRRSSKS